MVTERTDVLRRWSIALQGNCAEEGAAAVKLSWHPGRCQGADELPGFCNPKPCPLFAKPAKRARLRLIFSCHPGLVVIGGLGDTLP